MFGFLKSVVYLKSLVTFFVIFFRINFKMIFLKNNLHSGSKFEPIVPVAFFLKSLGLGLTVPIKYIIDIISENELFFIEKPFGFPKVEENPL